MRVAQEGSVRGRDRLGTGGGRGALGKRVRELRRVRVEPVEHAAARAHKVDEVERVRWTPADEPDRVAQPERAEQPGRVRRVQSLTETEAQRHEHEHRALPRGVGAQPRGFRRRRRRPGGADRRRPPPRAGWASPDQRTADALRTRR